ncbi:MAG: glycine betaine ABC transporter substrate-binding protein [Nitrospirota bacterium]
MEGNPKTLFMKKTALPILAALVVIGVLVIFSLISGDRPKPLITLYDGQWNSLKINNAIVRFIIEKGYGYPVKIVEETSTMMQASMQDGEIDLNMEMWRQNYMVWYDEEIKKGSIVNLGMTFESSPQVFIIPKWMSEQYDIKTVFDMRFSWELFKDPENPSKGLFYNCIIGWTCKEVNEVKIEAYELSKFYNTITPGSQEALKAALEHAQMNRQPIFAYYWIPTDIMADYEWHILEEPPYNDSTWKKIMEAIKDKKLRPLDQACAYPSPPIDKVAHKNLLKKAPDVVEMLRNMVIGLEPLNNTMAWKRKNEVKDFNKAAIYYLKNNKDRWKTWVTSDVYERINKALDENSG